MNKNSNQLPKWQIVALSALTIIVVLVIVGLFMNAKNKATAMSEPVETAATVATSAPTEAALTEPETTEPTVPEETEPVMLAFMAELYEQNPEIVGWISIPDTMLSYPVMHTPDDPEKYLHLSFEETYSVGGVPFLDEDCSLDPESDNLLIYGHNMNNGSQFATLMDYENKSFWEEHPVIYLSTLYETRTYEIIACFRDRVYYKHENVFKFYQFINAEDEAAFDEAYSNFKQKSCYDTGVTAEYGDNLITLVTCAYHTDNGRFVVVAKQVQDDV